VDAATTAISTLALADVMTGNATLADLNLPGMATDVLVLRGILSQAQASWVVSQPNTVAGMLDVANMTRSLLRLAGAVPAVLAPRASTVYGSGAASDLSGPAGVGILPSGDLAVADHGNARVEQITTYGSDVTLAGFGGAGNFDGPLSAARLTAPAAIAVSAAGTVYVGDDVANRLRRITASPAALATLLQLPASFGDASVNTPYGFTQPRGAALDAAGNLYVADTGNNRIMKVTPTGSVTLLAGGTGGYLDAAGPAAQFVQPAGLAVDATGSVYVADTGNRRIRKIAPSGAVTTVAGTGAAGALDGPAAGATFQAPTGLALDANGVLYVADRGANKIRLITPSGVVFTLAGSGTAGYADGTAASAQFDGPNAVAVDGFGNVFVTDGGNNRLRRIR
jgi:sugar lactone lactonase YvrE